MNDELEWLRSATPRTDDPDELTLYRARTRVLEEISPPVIRDHAGLVDLPIDDPLSARRAAGTTTYRRGSRIAVLGSLAVAAAIVVGIISLSGGGDGDSETGPARDRGEAADEALETTPEPSDTAPRETEQALAEDEAESRMLPLEVSAAHNLLDGQTVTVMGEGFIPNGSVGVLLCRGPAEGPNIGITGCDAATMTLGSVLEDGSIGIDFDVQRYIYIDGGPVDCAIDRCSVAAGMTDDYQISGRSSVTFDPSFPAAIAPVLAIEPSADLLDGQELTVRGSGFNPRVGVSLVQCVLGLPERIDSCSRPSLVDRIDAGGTGAFATTVTASRLLETSLGLHDCADLAGARCVLIAVGDRVSGASSLRFTEAGTLSYDGSVELPGPGVAITPPAGFVDLGPVTITVVGVRRPELSLCAAGIRGRCVGLVDASGEQKGSTFTVSLPLPRVFQAGDGRSHDCVADGPCELRIVAQGFPDDPLPLEYDSDAPLTEPITAVVEPTGPHRAGDIVTVTTPGAAGVSIRQCAASRPPDESLFDHCDDLGTQAFDVTAGLLVGTEAAEPEGGTDGGTRFVVFRRLVLRDGRQHDCVSDGPCELIIVADPGLGRFVPVPLEFDPATPPLSKPSVVLSRSFALDDGDTISVAVSNAGAFSHLDLQLCPRDIGRDGLCWSFGSQMVDGSGAATFDQRLPRRTRDSRTGEIVDCAAGCVLRIATSRARTEMSVGFDPSSPFLPDPVIELVPATFGPGEPVVVTGSGFLPLSDSRTPLLSLVCTETPELGVDRDTATSCGWPDEGLWEDDPVIEPDGRFTATLVAPGNIRLWSDDTVHSCAADGCLLVLTSSAPFGTAPFASIRLPLR